MDITKVTADILDGPNWGTWAVQIQAAARVLNCWSVIKGERIVNSSPPAYTLVKAPVQGAGARQISDAALFAKAAFKWNKMNSTALGLIQGKLNLALWPNYIDVGDDVLDPSGNEIWKSWRSQCLPPICRNDQNNVHRQCRSSVTDTEVPRKLSARAFQWSLNYHRGPSSFHVLFHPPWLIPRYRLPISQQYQWYYKIQIAANHKLGDPRRV